MATPRISQLQSATSSRLSLGGPSGSDSSRTQTPATGSNGQHRAEMDAAHTGRNDISTVLQEPTSSSSLLPALPALPSASSYLPSQLSSLSTTFTSAGTLPRSATPGGKSVAQRRSQAPPIQVTELRKVQRSEFEAYLKEVGVEFEKWEKESGLGRKGAADLRDEAEQGEEEEGEGEGFGLGRGGEGRAGKAKLPKPEEVLPSLEEVPPIFFDGNFNLSNPRTFDLVTERIQLSPHPSPHLPPSPAFPSSSTSSSSRPNPPARTGSISLSTSTAASLAQSSSTVTGLGPHTLTDLAADEQLQDKLSHYTAVIESHLVREIGLRSGAFFAALSNLQSLHQQGEDTLSKITELQGALSSTEDGGVGGTARHGLQILRAQARRRGLERIEEAVRAVEDVWGAVEGVKDLVENGEWEGALEVSEGIEEAYFGSAAISNADSPPPASPTRPTPSSSSFPSKPASTSSRRPHAPRLNLTKLSALSSLPIKLSLLRAQIAKSLEGELITVLEHEMDVGIEEYGRVEREGGSGRWKGKGREGEGKKGTAAGVVAASPAADGAASATSNGHALPGVPEEEAAEEADGAQQDQSKEKEEEEKDPSPESRARERAIERVRPVVRALVRAEGMDSAVAAWRESVLREVRALVREHLPTTETPTAEEEDHFAQAAIRSVSKQSIDLGTISEKSLSLAKKLRALPHTAFLSLARETYLGLLACIHVVDLQARVLLELVAQARTEEHARKARRRRVNGGGNGGGMEVMPQPPPSPSSGSSLTVPGTALTSVAVVAPPSAADSSRSSISISTDDASTLLSTEIADVVHAVAELANVRFSKVLGVRTEVHAYLPLEDFVALFDSTWDFVVQCEVVCQRMIVGLRGAVVSQAKSFLQQFHQKRLVESARTVEEEQWAAAEVPGARQREVERIIQAAMSDPVELLLGGRKVQRLAATQNGEATQDEEEDKAPAKQVDVEGKQFFAVPAGLTTIGVLVEYLTVLLNVPMLTTDCMSKIIEFMKAFNSRTCQVVLGAGAMRSAGLKNITAKHLALASQALSIMVSLIPYIRECVRRHLNPKQAVMLTEFDKLKRDYQEHQHEIHAKLVVIMSDRLQVHSRTMELISWEDPSSKAGAPNTYMESLVKEHLTLHKVLSRFLQPETVLQILGQVFVALDARLAEVLAPVEFRSEAAKERALVDVRYLREKLGDLKGLEGTGPAKDLEALVQSKPLPNPAAPPHSARPSFPPRTSSIAPSNSAFNSPSPALPPRTSTDAPPSPSISPLPPPSAVHAANVPLPVSTAASASTTSLALPPDGTGPSSSPRTSLEASRPPSPVPVPQPLPPAPIPVGPAPYVSKKKTLADRLAERLGKKPAAATAAAEEASAPAVPPTTVAQPGAEQPKENGAAPSQPEPVEEDKPAESAPIPTIVEPSPPTPTPASPTTTAADTPPPTNPVDALTPSAELDALKLDLLDAASPLPTPTKEELDEVEREVEREVEGEKGEEKVEADDGRAAPAPSVEVEAPVEEETKDTEEGGTAEQNGDVAAPAPSSAPAEAETEAVDVHHEKGQEHETSVDDAEEAKVESPTPVVEEVANSAPAPSPGEDASDVPPASAPEPQTEGQEEAAAPVQSPAAVEPVKPAPSAPLASPPESAHAPTSSLAPAPSASAPSAPVEPAPSTASTAPPASLPPSASAPAETPLSPTSTPLPTSPPAPAPAPAPGPPKKLTLKERLALAARKGSLGGSVVSPPPSPATATAMVTAAASVTSPPQAAPLKEGNEEKEQEKKEKEDLPSAPVSERKKEKEEGEADDPVIVQVEEKDSASVEKKKQEVKEELPAEVEVEVEVEEEESSFL